MYNLSIDTPANRMIAERLANNRIRSDMLFPTEPIHIMPHGIFSGGYRFTPYLLAGTNQQYPQLHMNEAMMISSGGMVHRPAMSAYRGEMDGYGMYGCGDSGGDMMMGSVLTGRKPRGRPRKVGGDVSGGDVSGGKGKKFLGMNTKQWKDVGKVAKTVGNVITPALIATNPELAPLILGANAGLQAIPTGKGISGGKKKKSVFSSVGNFVNKSAKSVAKVASDVWKDPAFQPVKAYGKDVAKEALNEVVQQYVAPQVADNQLGQLALAYGQNQANQQIDGAGRKRRGRPRKVGGDVSGGKIVGNKHTVQAKIIHAFGGDVSGGSRQKRGEIVKEIMKSKGLNLAQASSFVKQHGLYKK